MSPSNFFTKSTAQKVIVDYDFGCEFDDLKYLKLDFVFEFIVNLRATLQIFREEHQFYVVLCFFKQILDNYVFNISTCTLLAPCSKICGLMLNFFCQIICLSL